MSVTDSLIYHGGYWATFWTMTLGWSFRATGRDRVPATGPALILSNHASYLDPLLIGLASPRPMTYLAQSGLFKNKMLATLIRAYGAMPIERSVGKEGLQAVLDALKQERAVVMYPEGTRTSTGRIEPLKAGVTLLVKRADHPIVPCGIVGAYDAWNRHSKLPTFSPLLLPPGPSAIAVAFGEPIPPGFYRKMDRDDILTDLHARISTAHAAAKKLQRK